MFLYSASISPLLNWRLGLAIYVKACYGGRFPRLQHYQKCVITRRARWEPAPCFVLDWSLWCLRTSSRWSSVLWQAIYSLWGSVFQYSCIHWHEGMRAFVTAIWPGLIFQACQMKDPSSTPALALFFADASFVMQHISHHAVYGKCHSWALIVFIPKFFQKTVISLKTVLNSNIQRKLSIFMIRSRNMHKYARNIQWYYHWYMD